MTDLIALRDALRAHLKKSKTPQTQIASEIGVSQQWVSQFIAGRIASPGLHRFMRLQKWVERDRNKNHD
jgi:predicted transcriptional regulator